MNFNEPETDPGGCVWLSSQSEVRIACASSEDGCDLPDTCDRLEDAFTNPEAPAGGPSIPYGTVGEHAFRCARKAGPEDACVSCEPRFYVQFSAGCPTLCANAVRMPLSNQCPTGTLTSFLNPGWCCPVPTPTPTPTPEPTPFQCEPPFGSETQYCPYGTFYDTYSGLCCQGGQGSGCNTAGLAQECYYNVNDYCACQEYAGYWSESFCRCWAESPIIIDVEGNGFNLTNAANGVSFDMRADGTPDNLGWTAAGSDEAFLVFDRNGNGNIDNGKELFGNITPQPSHPNRNGFLALAEYDKAAQGGNEDGRMTRHDTIFDYLRPWRDSNHNGISEANELFALADLGLRRLDLDYRNSQRVDAHGNAFRYRAKVRDAQDAQLGRWAWDVFLVNENSSSRSIFKQNRIFALANSQCGSQPPSL